MDNSNMKLQEVICILVNELFIYLFFNLNFMPHWSRAAHSR